MLITLSLSTLATIKGQNSKEYLTEGRPVGLINYTNNFLVLSPYRAKSDKGLAFIHTVGRGGLVQNLLLLLILLFLLLLLYVIIINLYLKRKSS